MAIITGTAGNDLLQGTAADDTIIGLAGDDTLVGGGGIDHLRGGPGADLLDGTAGAAYADYADATSSVSAYLTWGAGNTGDAAGDRFTAISGLVGSPYDDILSGSDTAYHLEGGDGNDWLFGGAGLDFLFGGAGNDVLSGGSGGNNSSGDTFYGGDGSDVAYYRDAPNTVYTGADGVKLGMQVGHAYGVSLDVGNVANNFGEALGDFFVSVENLWGSRYDDIIRGDDSIGGQVYGFEGNDVLDGRGGDDVLYGGPGGDVMTGGAGADDFIYVSYDDHINQWGTLEAHEGGDSITDFVHGIDHITVSRYWFGFGNIAGPAQALTSTYADFVTANSTPLSSKPTFFWDSITGNLRFDPDGNGADATVVIAIVWNATLTLNDIWTA